MKRGRRDFLTIVGGAGAALLAAACGGSTNNASKTATTVATRAAATSGSATTATGGAAATATRAAAAVSSTPSGPVKTSTVTYYGGDNGPEEMAWHKKYNDDFAAAFPQYRAEDSEFATVDMFTKMQTALASNSPLDMMFRDVSGGNTTASLWDQGLLAPANDVMEDVYTMIGGKDKFDSAAVTKYTIPSGELIGVPFLAPPRLLWYRADLLQQAGLTPPADGHWDWNFLLKAVKATHKPPEVYGMGIALARNAATVWLTGTLVMNNGGHFLSPDLKDVVFDSAEVRETFDFVKELSAYAPPDAVTWNSANQIDAIDRGSVAIGEYGGRPYADLVNKSPALVSKYFNSIIPYNKVPRSFGGAGVHALFKGKNLAGAKELAKFSMRKEQFISYLLVSPGQYPAIIPAYGADPSYTGSPVLMAYDPKMLANSTEAGKNAFNFLQEGPGWKLNLKAGTLDGSLFLAEIVQKVVVGKESTASAVTAGANAIRDIMKG